jgi:hypothetical protein
LPRGFEIVTCSCATASIVSPSTALYCAQTGDIHAAPLRLRAVPTTISRHKPLYVLSSNSCLSACLCTASWLSHFMIFAGKFPRAFLDVSIESNSSLWMHCLFATNTADSRRAHDARSWAFPKRLRSKFMLCSNSGF